jgi:hypothetical protein
MTAGKRGRIPRKPKNMGIEICESGNKKNQKVSLAV